MPTKAKTEKSSAAKKRNPEPAGIFIPKMQLKTFRVKVSNTDTGAPIVLHAWSRKAIQMMLDKQMGKPSAKRKEPKNPVMDFFDTLYWMEERPEKKLVACGPEDYAEANNIVKGHQFGFPSIGFKKAMVSACRNVEGMEMALARGAFLIIGDGTDVQDEMSMVKLMSGKKPAVPRVRQDMVRLSGKTADIRFRAEFVQWEATLTIKYNAGVMTPDQIINLLNIAGFAVGVGENRPEKNGQWGTFQVVGA